MKVLLLLSLFATTLSYAEEKAKEPVQISTKDGMSGMRLKPGLWTVDMKIIGPDGKEFNPMGMMAAAMDNLPEEKKKMIMAKMGGAGIGGGKQGMKVCMTPGMANEPADFTNHDKSNCDSKIVEQTSSKIKAEFKCKDGASGVSLWKVKSPSEYTGVVKMKQGGEAAKAGESTMKFEGKFEATDCGDVKPMKAPAKQ